MFFKVLIGIFLLLLSLIIPAYLWSEYISRNNSDINYSEFISQYTPFAIFIISFWGVVLNFILVFIAYKAFKNFEIKKKFHSDQLDVMSALVTSLGNSELSNMIYRTTEAPNGERVKVSAGFTFSLIDIVSGFDYRSLDMVCMRSNNMENIFPFLRYRSHPILPVEIARHLKKIYQPISYKLTLSEDQLPENYVVFYSNNLDEDDFSKAWVFDLYDSPNKFHDDFEGLIKEISVWFKKYGVDDINL